MPASVMLRIRKKLGHAAFEAKSLGWLDTGSKLLNGVFGGPKGIPWGKLIELFGFESQGKTLLAMHLCALAQKAGAQVIWLDAENSFDAAWAITNGMDVDLDPEGNVVETRSFVLFQPYIGLFGKERDERMITAQELCDEVEQYIKARARHKKTDDTSRRSNVPPPCFFLVADSVSALNTEDELQTDLADQNLPTSMSLPKFMTKLLRRWVALANCYACTMLFINQLKVSPMQKFGNPEYTPGGKALKFYCHIRVRAGRAKGGKILQAGKTIGIQGIMRNIKNKAGGVEWSSCGYKLFFEGRLVIMAKEKIKKLSKEKEGE